MSFLDQWNKIKKFWVFSNFDENRIKAPNFFIRRNIENLLISKFVFVDCKTAKVSQMIKFDCKYDLHVFFILMNGTKL